MTEPKYIVIDLNKLSVGLPGLLNTFGSLLAEASRVCFHSQGHNPSVLLSVIGSFDEDCHITWSEEMTEQILRSWNDQQEATEYGACGIAILLVLTLTEYTIVRRSAKGTGFDYWLGFQNFEYPFQDSARLEVSGILNGGESAIQSRMKLKMTQTRVSDGALPAHIVVVEFGKPTSQYMVKT